MSLSFVIPFTPFVIKLVINGSRIIPNLKSIVYCNAIASGGVEEWDFAWSMFKNASLASEADKLLHAMSCTKTPWLLNRSVVLVSSRIITYGLCPHGVCVLGTCGTVWTQTRSASRTPSPPLF